MIADKLAHYFPNAEWTINGDNYQSLVWLVATPKPTQAEIDALVWPPVIDLSALDQTTLNEALSAPGSVVRALALLLLQEINTVRARLPTPLPAYTQAQLVAALKAKMR